ncbi:hypothetical protein [Brevibacillus laterosporus]|nr:hypothetical protein [Brevibacillus laterosporus]MDN9011436.1 hypothetical protein [Brevibacillus laterosporus]MDO0942386.1 hypothetical protein [Brevibacillus laterosporus]
MGNQIETVGFLHASKEAIQHIYFVKNPDKLRYVETVIGCRKKEHV